MAGQFDAIHTRHADVGKHDIDRMVAQELQRRDAVAGLADDLAGELDGDVGEQLAQAVAGQRLVIDDEDLQRFGVRHGRTMRTS
jgi:hypothetical protein